MRRTRTIRIHARSLPRVAAGLLVAVAATAGEPAAKVTYEDHLAPVIRRYCRRCHNQDRKKGGIALDSYAAILEGGSSGAAVTAGDPEASRLWRLVAHEEEPYMPPGRDRIEDDKLAVFRGWIEGGLLETASSKARAAAKPAMELSFRADPAAKPEGPPPMPVGLSLEPTVETLRPGAIDALAASPWAPLAAVGGPRQVLLHDLEGLALAGVLPFPEGRPRVLRFSRDGALLLAGGGQGAALGKVVVWEVRTGERLLEAGDEDDSVLGADISADRSLVALGGPSRRVKIFSTADGELLHSIRKHTDWVLALEFSPDGVLLASGGRAGGLHVWEAMTGREYLTLRGHTGAVTDVSWRADSNVLASASEDGTVRLWEMENGREVKRWNAHPGGVLALDFGRDGKLATAGRDRRAKLWDASGRQIHAPPPLGDIATAVAVAPASGQFIAGDWTGALRVFAASDGKLAGTLVANPPSLAGKIAEAREALAREERALAEAAARVTELASVREAAREALAEARRVLEEREAALEAAEGKVREAESVRDAARGRVEGARQGVEELETRAGTAGPT